MAKKSTEPKPDERAAGEIPAVKTKPWAGRRGKPSIITKKDGVKLDPPKKRGKAVNLVKKAEREKAAAAKVPHGEPRPLDLKPKKKTPAEAKADRDGRKKKAADAEEIRIYNLRNKIMDLREGGASIRRISEHLIEQGETACAPSTVFGHLEAGLDLLRNEFTLKYKNFIQVRLNQMYRVELSHFKRLCDTTLTPDDFEKLSRGMDRIWKRMDDLIDRLTDNHKTTKVEVTGTDGGPVETVTRVILPTMAEEHPEEE